MDVGARLYRSVFSPDVRNPAQSLAFFFEVTAARRTDVGGKCLRAVGFSRQKQKLLLRLTSLSLSALHLVAAIEFVLHLAVDSASYARAESVPRPACDQRLLSGGNLMMALSAFVFCAVLDLAILPQLRCFILPYASFARIASSSVWPFQISPQMGAKTAGSGISFCRWDRFERSWQRAHCTEPHKQSAVTSVGR